MNRKEYDRIKDAINDCHNDNDYNYLMGILMEYFFDNKMRK